MADAIHPAGDFLRGSLTVFAVVLSVVLVIQLIYTFLAAPHLVIQNVVLRSDVPLSQGEVLKQAGLQDRRYYFSLDEKTVRERLEGHPEIRAARVKKEFPDTVILDVHSRKPLALSLVEGVSSGGAPPRTLPVAFDSEGVVFRVAGQIQNWDLPVLSGIRFEGVERGGQLPPALQPLLQDLQELRREAPELYGLISEMKVIRRGIQDYDLLLCLTGYPLKVRLGNRLDAGLLKQSLLVADMMADQPGAGEREEVDFRTGEVVFSVRGE